MTVLSYQHFLHQAEYKLANVNNPFGNYAVLTVNLQRLAELDGILGYITVDQIVQKVSEQLKDALNPEDLVGITGRYQISCLLVNLLAKTHAMLAAYKILRILTLPMILGQQKILLSPCIGVACNNEQHSALDQLMRHASLALYQATQSRTAIQLFEENTDDTRLAQLNLWSDLDEAIETGTLHLAYQPKYSIATGNIESTEALLRWTHPEHGPISPDKLIRLAEGSVLMPKLTQWIFHTALRECATYREAGINAGVSINFSADDLREPELVDFVAQAIAIWNVPAECIMVEMTETAVMEHQEATLDTLYQLKDIGFKLSMDDFGTGYSSMERMLELPFDEVKIDMLFVRKMTQHPRHEHIVESIIKLAHQLNLQVVAEGVEDIATYKRLEALGCDVIQGYLIGKPMPLTELVKTINNQSLEFLNVIS